MWLCRYRRTGQWPDTQIRGIFVSRGWYTQESATDVRIINLETTVTTSDDYWHGKGIHGYEEYRGDLALMYCRSITPARGKLVSFEVVPFQISQFRLNWATEWDATWLKDILNR